MKNRDFVKKLLHNQIVKDLLNNADTNVLMEIISHLSDEEIVELLNNKSKEQL